MAQMTRHIIIMATAASLLGGCSLIGSVADTTWSGTKTVAKWVSAPVRYVLRGTPDEETQFAGADVETEETVALVETTTVETAETTQMAEADLVAAAPFEAEVATVETATVTSFEPVSYSTRQSTTSTSYTTSATILASQSSQSFATASVSDDSPIWDSPSRYSIQTSSRGDRLHFVRLKGETSMSDWMDCDRSSDGYWVTSSTGGTINPAFEVCMRGMDYVLKTELGSYDTAELTPASTITRQTVSESNAMPVLVGESAKPQLRSSYVPTKEPQTGLPHKF